jgi:hypothetical protein
LRELSQWHPARQVTYRISSASSSGQIETRPDQEQGTAISPEHLLAEATLGNGYHPVSN